MSLIKTEYRIEVWQDKWENDAWTELKVATIGANDMDYLGKAINPILKRDVTGEISFSFDMMTKYMEPTTGKKEDNYLVSYLFNETKIKLYCPQYDDGINGGWFDFIIKGVKDNRGTNISFNYTCQYLPINELAKTGQGLTFSLELENATGKIDELEQKVLEGTEWVLGDIAADLTEATEETLFQVTTGGLLLTGVATMLGTPNEVTIPSNSTLYIPYSEIMNTTSTEIQVIYVEGDTDNLILANGNVISNKMCNYTVLRSSFGTPVYSPSNYRGYKVVLTPKTAYKNVSTDITPNFRYVSVYSNPNNLTVPYYKYYNTEVVMTPDVTFSSTGDLVTKTAHGLITDNVVSFSKINTEEFAPGVTIDTLYFVKKIDDNSFQLSKEMGLDKLIITLFDGTGTITKDIVVESVAHYFYNDGDSVKEVTDTNIINSLTPVMITGSEKYRTLEASQSNRFNLTQSIAELFEVWARYDIYHDANGKITEKKISFVDTIGSQNWVGFTYGINLTELTRDVISTSLATKMFVEDIENENLTNGACSIAYAKENIAKDKFLINLDYFVQVGLLDNDTLIYDLYDVDGSTGIGYLTKLGNLNTQYDSYPDVETYIRRYKDLVETMTYAITHAKEIKDRIFNAYKGGLGNSDAIADFNANYTNAVALVATNETKKNDYQVLLDSYREQQTAINAAKTSILAQKVALNNEFNNRYSRFIQEGSWTGENTYIGDDLYYYDAQNVLLESSRPSIQYTLNVLDLSILPGYEDYNYKIGDITYIEDTEYFGFTKPDLHGNSRPYREQVIISAIESNLDSPKDNKITIQNYKNEFDSLFQRITATSQSYQLNEQVYNRANNFTSTGQITFNSLQASLVNNSLILSRSTSEDVIINGNGIYLTDLNDVSKMVRVVSGGIFISSDAGVTWNSGITGAGINTKLLTAGQIDVGKINIMNGAHPSFSWDSTGLYAYSYVENGLGELTAVSKDNYVCFDHNGIHGVINDTGFTNPIYTRPVGTKFSLDWNGLYLKTGSGSHDIQLGSHIIDSTEYLFSAIKNSDDTRTFSIDANGNAFFSGIVNVKELFINGVEALTADNKIKSDFIDVSSLTAETVSTSNAWISNLYAEVVNTNFLDYITGTDVNDVTIGNDKLKRNYIHIEDQDLEMIEQVLTLTPVDFTILINNINRQVYYTYVRGEDAYNFYSIVDPLVTSVTWKPNKNYKTNQIILGENNNYYYALSGYTGLYTDWSSALASGFLIATTTAQHKVQVKTITSQNIKSSYGFVDTDGVAIPKIQLGIGTGVGDNGKAAIYKGLDGLYFDYYSTAGALRRIMLGDEGITISPYDLESIDMFNNGFSAEYNDTPVAMTWTLDANGRITSLITNDNVTIPVTWHTEDM